MTGRTAKSDRSCKIHGKRDVFAMFIASTRDCGTSLAEEETQVDIHLSSSAPKVERSWPAGRSSSYSIAKSMAAFLQVSGAEAMAHGKILRPLAAAVWCLPNFSSICTQSSSSIGIDTAHL